jgi:hypothetical protein
MAAEVVEVVEPADSGATTLAVIAVTRSGDLAAAVGARYATADGTAHNPYDYPATTGEITIPAGQASASFTVPVRGDLGYESPETFTVTLTESIGGAVLDPRTTTAVRILSTDPPPTYRLMSTGVIAYEGGRDGCVKILSSDSWSTETSVDYATADGSATAGADYRTLTGTLRTVEGPLNDKQRKVSVCAAIVDDDVAEADETFTLSLANPTGGASIGHPDTVQVTIIDNEPHLRFAATDPQHISERAGTVMATVTRTGDTSAAVSARIQPLASTAENGTDYQMATDTVTLAPGQATAQLPVTLINDDDTEPGESLTLGLTDVEGIALGTPATMRIHIYASDQQPDAQVSTRAEAGYLGNDVYNTSGVNQTRTVAVRRGGATRFYIRVYNDGNARIGIMLQVRPAAALTHVTVRSGSFDVTPEATHGGYLMLIYPGRFLQYRIDATVRRDATPGSVATTKVTASWNGDSFRSDSVKAATRVRR